MTAASLDLGFVVEQYRRFLPDLRRVREEQRRRYAERSDPNLERVRAYRALSTALRALRRLRLQHARCRRTWRPAAGRSRWAT
ncbi:MAG: hypothetical protein ACRDZ4_18365 [Egibacteraceae bacterium]